MDFLVGREKMFSKLSLRNEAGLRLTFVALRALPLNGFERSENYIEEIAMKRFYKKNRKIEPVPFTENLRRAG